MRKYERCESCDNVQFDAVLAYTEEEVELHHTNSGHSRSDTADGPFPVTKLWSRRSTPRHNRVSRSIRMNCKRGTYTHVFKNSTLVPRYFPSVYSIVPFARPSESFDGHAAHAITRTSNAFC